MDPSPMPKALWLLPASLLAAVIAGACLGHSEREPEPVPDPVEQTLPTAKKVAH